MLQPWQATPWDLGRKVQLHKVAALEQHDGPWVVAPLQEVTRQALDLQAQDQTIATIMNGFVGVFDQHDRFQPMTLGLAQAISQPDPNSGPRSLISSLFDPPDVLTPQPIIDEQIFALKTAVFTDLLKSTIFEVLDQMLEAEPVPLNPKVKFEIPIPSDPTKREEAKDKRNSELNKSYEQHLIRKILGINLQP